MGIFLINDHAALPSLEDRGARFFYIAHKLRMLKIHLEKVDFHGIIFL
jgi:hypothetical protein